MSNTGINLRQTSPNLIIKTLLTTYQLILDRGAGQVGRVMSGIISRALLSGDKKFYRLRNL